MLFNYLTGFETVQFALAFGVGIWGVVFMILRSNRLSEELKSEDQRQKDAFTYREKVNSIEDKSETDDFDVDFHNTAKRGSSKKHSKEK